MDDRSAIPHRTASTRVVLALLAVTLVAGWLRLYALDRESLWMDEHAQVSLYRLPARYVAMHAGRTCPTATRLPDRRRDRPPRACRQRLVGALAGCRIRYRHRFPAGLVGDTYGRWCRGRDIRGPSGHLPAARVPVAGSAPLRHLRLPGDRCGPRLYRCPPAQDLPGLVALCGRH